MPEVTSDSECATIKQHRQRLEALLAAVAATAASRDAFPPAVPDEDLVNALAQYAAFEPIERQALLECDGVLARCRALIELLEMKTMALRGCELGRRVRALNPTPRSSTNVRCV